MARVNLDGKVDESTQDAKRELALGAKRAKAGLPKEAPPGHPPGRHGGRPYSLTQAQTQAGQS